MAFFSRPWYDLAGKISSLCKYQQNSGGIRLSLHLSQAYIDQFLFPNKHDKQIAYSDLEKYHADIFEYYTKLVSVEMDMKQTEQLDRLLRASRNIMNATKNIYELRDE